MLQGVLAVFCFKSFSNCKEDQIKTVAISQMFKVVLVVL